MYRFPLFLLLMLAALGLQADCKQAAEKSMELAAVFENLNGVKNQEELDKQFELAEAGIKALETANEDGCDCDPAMEFLQSVSGQLAELIEQKSVEKAAESASTLRSGAEQVAEIAAECGESN